ncbi:adenine methyltransferase, partial [Acinetobacter baumannii]|nr:adenine methyltransferase [Acinetobacter baumannii]
MNTMAQSKLFGLAENRTDVWSTPQDFFEKLDRVFNFDLDVCALPENAKCERYFTPEIDGLKQEWSGTCWMNPPYGKEIIDWVAKAAE